MNPVRRLSENVASVYCCSVIGKPRILKRFVIHLGKAKGFWAKVFGHRVYGLGHRVYGLGLGLGLGLGFVKCKV